MLLVGIIKQTALALLGVLDVAMFVRAILSWIDPMGDGPLASFLYAVTEPLILPYRKLFEKLNWFADSPIDVAFFFTLITITVLQTLLEVLIK